MAKVQIITAMTLDGFLPGEDEELFKWVKTDKRGFPFWHGRSTFMLPIGYPMLDLICEKNVMTKSPLYAKCCHRPKKRSLKKKHSVKL